LHNLKHLKIDVDSIDMVVLSHGHYDHAGGLVELLFARSSPLDVYAHPGVRERKRKGPLGLPLKNIGFPRLGPDLEDKMRFHAVTEWTALTEHVHLTGEIEHRPDRESVGPKMLRHDGQGWVQDHMEDEISLVISGAEGPIVIMGCGHPGLTNILRHVVTRFGQDVHTVIGGAHMEKISEEDAEAVAKQIVKEFKTPQLYLNHCTGPIGIMRLREHLTLDGVRDCFVGTELLFEL
jgi:7,8-dihydropterin-6-yl-methyl-4-(beta-D-ribofuranosyl)aminobenzene 5'-phosphate synthase